MIWLEPAGAAGGEDPTNIKDIEMCTCSPGFCRALTMPPAGSSPTWRMTTPKAGAGTQRWGLLWPAGPARGACSCCASLLVPGRTLFSLRKSRSIAKPRNVLALWVALSVTSRFISVFTIAGLTEMVQFSLIGHLGRPPCV